MSVSHPDGRNKPLAVPAGVLVVPPMWGSGGLDTIVNSTFKVSQRNSCIVLSYFLDFYS